MRTRTIGTTTVSAIGLGAMPLSVKDRPDRERAIATVHAALDAGVTLIDTADAYHRDASDPGHNELLVAEALKARDTADVLVATKGGHTRTADGGWALDGTPEHLHRACDLSLQRLGVDAIGLYQFHRPDPEVPFAESVGALAELHAAGKIQMAGISNADPDQIREARGILGEALVSVQNQYSPAFQTSRPELEVCEQLGLAFLPWSPLGGMSKAAGLGDQHAVFAEIAAAHDVTPQQVTLAWMLATSEHIVPIPGSSRPETITASAAAADLELSSAELAQLDAAVA